MPKLANICVTDNGGRMGRPPLGVKFTAIRLSPKVLERIDAIVGTGKRSEFIREAIEKELRRRERARSPD